jgi:hypothetical protein
MTAPMMNGTQRKSLSQQLDRLDSILDGLAESLNGAVADAVRDAVGQAVSVAVQEAVRQVLAQPELVRRLAPPPAEAPTVMAMQPSGAPKTSLVRRFWQKTVTMVRCCACCVRIIAGSAVVAMSIRTQRLTAPVRATLRVLKYNPRLACWALSVGLASGLASYWAGPWAAAMISGLITAALTAIARLLAPLSGLLPTEKQTA